MFRIISISVLTVALGVISPLAYAVSNCQEGVLPRPLPLHATNAGPIASELFARSVPLGTPNGVLSQSYNDAQSVDRVLLRKKLSDCPVVAKAVPPPVVPPPASTNTANSPTSNGYVPKTEFDNTPWRFDMTQDGKKMTADEFDAWMKAKGVRVVKATEETAVAEPPATATAPVPATSTTAPKKDK